MPSDSESADAIVLPILDHLRPSKWQTVLPNVHCTEDGFLINNSSEFKTTIGFGVFAHLTPSFELLSEIGDLNQTANLGHVWLAEGSDNNHWSLVWGMKVPFGFNSDHSFGMHIFHALDSYQDLHSMVAGKTQQFGGAPYWGRSESFMNSAIVLMSSLA